MSRRYPYHVTYPVMHVMLPTSPLDRMMNRLLLKEFRSVIVIVIVRSLSVTGIYLGASLYVNSEMETSLFQTCQYSHPLCTSPRCEWSLTWMYLGASLSTNSEMGTSLFQTCQYSRPRSLYFSGVSRCASGTLQIFISFA